ncbi:MAG: anti-sigma factor antagonist [Lachnospiraceae bacterium]|nr:anti-sigma factor antagonist [Lachnospiraceae bacterium]
MAKEMKFKLNQDLLTIALEGHIDSANANETEAAINEIRSANPSKAIVFDCEALQYISSAGLRIILRTLKAVPQTSLVNVSSEVYDVLEMTGFTEMMEVKKGYRVLSVEGSEVIGAGSNGKVYRIDRDTIVKVYRNPDALPEIHRERELARTAFVLGVPTAIPYDVVRIEGGGYGSVFELLNAKSYASLLDSGEKTTDEIAKMSIDLLKIIHGTIVKPDSMPDMRAVAVDWIRFLEPHLPKEQYDKLLAMMEAVPEDDHMLHGDYHIKNIMLQNGESLLIDMDTLCHGHPIFELASMYTAYILFPSMDPSEKLKFLGITHETARELWEKELRLYLAGESEETIERIANQAMTISYARILRRTIKREGYEKGREMIENCKSHLSELLKKVDKFTF